MNRAIPARHAFLPHGLRLLLAIGALSGPAAAQETVESFRCGHARLAEALQAHGGEAQVAGFTRLRWRVQGQSRNAYQGLSAAEIDAPQVDGRLVIEAAVDLAAGRWLQTTRQRLRGGFDVDFSLLVQGTQVDALRWAEKRFVRSQAPSAEAATAQALDLPARFFPPWLLRRARENLASVRCLPTGAGERPAFEFNWDARTRMRLALDDAHRVYEMRVLQPDLMDGELELVLRYLDYGSAGALAVPARIHVLRRWALQFDLELAEVHVDAPFEPGFWQLPADFSELKQPAGLWHAPLAEGLWEVRGIAGGLYRTPVVELEDGLLLFDAPLGPLPTRQVLAHVRQHISAKPVRHVVISHFHGDHAGGAAAYADAGATLWVNEADRPFVQRLLAQRTRLQPPLRPAPAPGPDAVQVAADGQLFGSPGAPRARIHRLPGSPHVAQMLLLQHLPSRTLIEADLYSTLSPFNPTYAHFAAWLAQQQPLPLQVIGVHHDPLPSAELMERARAYGAPR